MKRLLIYVLILQNGFNLSAMGTDQDLLRQVEEGKKTIASLYSLIHKMINPNTPYQQPDDKPEEEQEMDTDCLQKKIRSNKALIDMQKLNIKILAGEINRSNH